MRMRQIFRATMLVVLAAGAFSVSAAQGQDRIRIGVLNDQSGVFATYQGVGSVIAAQMAVEDYGGKAAGKQSEIVKAGHQNKTKVGGAVARGWEEKEKGDGIFYLPNFPIAPAGAHITRQK